MVILLFLLRRPLVCSTYTTWGAGKEDEGEGGAQQPGPQHQVQNYREVWSNFRTKVEKIQSVVWGEMWPAELLSMQNRRWW